MSEQISITISGPRAAGKTVVAHLIWGTLRALGCKVEVREDGDLVGNIDKAAAAAVHRKKPSVIITTKQT